MAEKGNAEQCQKFALRLNQALHDSKMTARKLSQITGINEAYISRYRKAYAMPSRGRIFDLASAFGVSPLWLLGYADDPAQNITDEERKRNEIDNLIEGMSLPYLTYVCEVASLAKGMSEDQRQKALQFIKDYILS